MDSDRARGVLLGLACGDALGRPVEFATPSEIGEEYGQLDEMIGYGTWNQPPGTITDDTEQALCIARSLVEQQGFDPADIADRFVAWYDSDPFDIGRMTARSLREFKHGSTGDEAGQQVWENSPEGQNAGNGSVMRCPPLALPYASNWEQLVEVSRQSSQITTLIRGVRMAVRFSISRWLAFSTTPARHYKTRSTMSIRRCRTNSLPRSGPSPVATRSVRLRPRDTLFTRFKRRSMMGYAPRALKKRL